MSYTNKQDNRYGKPIKSKSHDFSRIPSANIPRSVFDRSHGHKTAFNASYLVPVLVDEALPGDTFHVGTQALVRLSTPIVPIMDNMKLDIHYFSVPNRLLWDNWQRFMGERKAPNDSVDFLLPTVFCNSITGAVPTGSIHDYMGIPTNITVPDGSSGYGWSALPIRAYHLIVNEWFRDQNLSAPGVVVTDDRDLPWTDYSGIVKRSKRHDYFTSCLPWPQKGEGVELPLGVPEMTTTRPRFKSDTDIDLGGFWCEGGVPRFDAGGDYASVEWLDTGIQLHPSEAFTINTLRQAFQMQRMLERDARGGSRYVEIIRSHFGVISPDSRVQRPEYLGMSSFDVNVNPVIQNGATTGESPQGNLAAYGVAGGSQHGFSHSFVEHCTILGIASIRCDQTYQYGTERMFNRRTRFDFYWPTLAHLGEQAVLNREIYIDGTADDDKVFGYQERYAEYRYKPSRVSGVMRSSSPQSTDAWHLAQEWSGRPALNQQFIEETDVPLKRCVAVQDEPQFIADFHFNMRCVRPMPTYSVPGMIDHF